MKRKINSAILVVLLISLTIILGSVRKVPAKFGCSNSSLRGSYGLHATGIDDPGGVPFAAVGVFTFDGAGNLTGNVFFRTPGSTVHAFPVGTYTVHSDCTVSDTFGGNQHESVIVDDGRGYLIINTSEGVISGEAHKQFRGGDHDED